MDFSCKKNIFKKKDQTKEENELQSNTSKEKPRKSFGMQRIFSSCKRVFATSPRQEISTKQESALAKTYCNSYKNLYCYKDSCNNYSKDKSKEENKNNDSEKSRVENLDQPDAEKDKEKKQDLTEKRMGRFVVSPVPNSEECCENQHKKEWSMAAISTQRIGRFKVTPVSA